MITKRQSPASITGNSFNLLEELDLFNISCSSELDSVCELQLNLPMLNSIQFVQVRGVKKLTLDALKLQKVKVVDSLLGPELVFVHGELVEKLIVDDLQKIDVKQVKNLKYLYARSYPKIDSKLLLTLDRLEKIHLDCQRNISNLFEQRKQSDRLLNLKIFLCGFLLDAPIDPATKLLNFIWL